MEEKHKESTFIIPAIPDDFVLDEKSKELLEGWIEHFQKMSPRIKIVRPHSKEFNLKKYRNNVIEHKQIPKGGVLEAWPLEQQVAFVLMIDSAFPGQDSVYLVKDGYIFCFKDFAFGFDHFEWEGDEEDPFNPSYSLHMWSEDALCWQWTTEIIKRKLKELAQSVPNIPKDE